MFFSASGRLKRVVDLSEFSLIFRVRDNLSAKINFEPIKMQQNALLGVVDLSRF